MLDEGLKFYILFLTKGQIAIPKDIRELEGFTEGSKIVVLAYDDHVELRPITEVKGIHRVKSIETALLSEKTLGKDWNTKKEDDAWKDL